MKPAKLPSRRRTSRRADAGCSNAHRSSLERSLVVGSEDHAKLFKGAEISRSRETRDHAELRYSGIVDVKSVFESCDPSVFDAVCFIRP